VAADFQILVADRNPHVREFLRREMAGEGYRVRLARNAHELLEEGLERMAADLLILDPDLPGMELGPLLQRIGRGSPAMRIVVHALPDDTRLSDPCAAGVIFVEKGGNSIERLKRVVAETRRSRPGAATAS
jgi:DNA-binding response OmpR family regulator